MATYQVPVKRYSEGIILVEADSSDAAFEIGRDSLNEGTFSEIRSEQQIGDITEAPKIDALPEDATPEEIEVFSALIDASSVLEVSKANIAPVDAVVDVL